MRLSPGQRSALTAIAGGVKYTSNYTAGDYVSGTAAKALESRELATRRALKDGNIKVSITPAGRKAVKELLAA